MANDRHKWPDFVQEFNTKYNETKHSTLGMTPNEAFTTKQKEAMIKTTTQYYKPRPISKVSFVVGDKVRIVNVREKFSKGYEEKWSRQVFEIKKTKPTNPPTYVLMNNEGVELDGGYYAQELMKVT